MHLLHELHRHVFEMITVISLLKINVEDLYFFGGWNSGNKDRYNDLYEYNISMCKWKKVNCSSSPPPLAGQSAVLFNGEMVIFGGNTVDDDINNVYKYNIQKMEWKKIECTGDIPEPRSYQTLIVGGDKIWMFGGWGKSDSK